MEMKKIISLFLIAVLISGCNRRPEPQSKTHRTHKTPEEWHIEIEKAIKEKWGWKKK